METISHRNVDERRKRVRRLKKLIVAVVIVTLLLLTVCCLLLFFKIEKLESRVDTIVAKKNNIEEFTSEEKVASSIVYSADTKTKEQWEGKDSEKLTKEEELDKTIKEKKVYLTFDDGPGQYTDELLDVLAEYDIKATFFVIGKSDEHSIKMYKRIVKEGHTLAMHSYTHKYDKIYESVKMFDEDFNKLSDLLYEATGERPKYYRFPGGSSNTVSNLPMTNFISYLNKKGITYFDWNVINGDATGKKLSSEQMINSVMSGIRQHDTSIVLMHDMVSKNTTVKSLPALIEKLQKEDYVILPITKYTKAIQHVKAESVK
ncbi:polysaccharide deacetylase family protein [Velocimicrobium porci]|uniref:Polysaccharide deacetylase n=1 Tax=Velocimicrobium porci TaxID=2606634 RepID=A0A6L5Y2N4_9FIRM|nr:polysaccharide deacetylase family protein [Velocimicrobium porci]MSS64618.1 polysaccharide deacetylase [Velocimicrobium porci]